MTDLDPFAPMRRHLLFLLLVVGCLLWTYIIASTLCPGMGCGQREYAVVNFVGLAVLLAASAYTFTRLVRSDLTYIWTPAALYLASTALFFGFGNMVHIFADEATRTYLAASAYGITLRELLRANLLTALGIFCTLTAILVVLRLRGPQGTQRSFARPIPTDAVAAIFIGVGLFLKFGIIVPAEFSTERVVVSGTIKNLGQLADLGFALAAYRSAQGSAGWRFLFWALWPIHLVLGAMQFSKAIVMMALLLPAVGAFMAHNNWRRVVPWLLVAAISFSFLQTINTSARYVVNVKQAHGIGSGFQDRIEIVKNLVAAGGKVAQYSDRPIYIVRESQVWWLRLAYAGPQIRAMEQYDRGNPGEQLQSPLVYIIPRFLWPDKPILESPGQVLNRVVRGKDDAGSRVGATVYADGYWQYGWIGVVVFSSVMGTIFGFITIRSYFQIKRRDFLFFPVVFVGMDMAALSTTGYLQNSILGAVPIYIGFSVIAAMITQFWRQPQAGTGIPAPDREPPIRTAGVGTGNDRAAGHPAR